MFDTFHYFDEQNKVKEISIGSSARHYPTKLMRYWITSNLIPQKHGLKIAEVGIGRGEMKYWVNAIQPINYSIWDGYDVSRNPHIDGAGYSNIYFGFLAWNLVKAIQNRIKIADFFFENDIKYTNIPFEYHLKYALSKKSELNHFALIEKK